MSRHVFYCVHYLPSNDARPQSHISEAEDALDYEEVTLSQGFDYEDVSFPPPSAITLGETKEGLTSDRLVNLILLYMCAL